MKIRIQNFRTISNLELEFGERTLVWALNGHGKSNVVSAFQWVFTGRCYVSEGAQENLSQLIQKGADAFRVIYEDEHLLIDRTGGKKALRVVIDGIELKGNTAEVEEQLQQYLGVAGWKESEIGMEWLRSVALSPDSPTIFDMKRADLGQFLSSLFHLEVFTKLKQSFQEDFSKVDGELRALEKYPVEKSEPIDIVQLVAQQASLGDKLVSVPNAQSLTQLGQVLKKKQSDLSRLSNFSDMLFVLDQEMNRLVKPEGLEETKQQLANIDQQLFGKRRFDQRLETEKNNADSKLKALEVAKRKFGESQLHAEPEIPFQSIEADLVLSRALLQESQAAVRMLEASLSGKPCPACGAELLVTMNELELLDKPKVMSLLELEHTKLALWKKMAEGAEADKESWRLYQESQLALAQLASLNREEQSVRERFAVLVKEVEDAQALEPLFQQRAVLAQRLADLEGAESHFVKRERELLSQKSELQALASQLPVLEKEIHELEQQISLGKRHQEDFIQLETLKTKIAQAEMQNKLAEQFRVYTERLEKLKAQKEFYAFCLSEATFLLSHQIETRKAEFVGRMNEALTGMELENQVKIDLSETKDGEIKGVEIKAWSCGEWRNFATGINKASQTVLRTIAGIVQRNLFESRLKVPFLLVDDPGYGCQNEVLENLFAGLKKLAKGNVIVFTAYKGAEALLEPEKVYRLEMVNNETRLACV